MSLLTQLHVLIMPSRSWNTTRAGCKAGLNLNGEPDQAALRGRLLRRV
jgi:hypothetical protein